jgi:hypothetical protein
VAPGASSSHLSGGSLVLSIGETLVGRRLSALPTAPDARSLWARLAKASNSLPDGWPLGLEHDLIRRKIGVCEIAVVSPKGDVSSRINYVDRPGASVFLRRPPSELAARLFWDRLTQDALQPADLLRAASLLGVQAQFRSGPMRTTRFASGHVLEYLSADKVPKRLERLLRNVGETAPRLHPLLHATGVYFDTLLIHPLPDGNGRLARLLFQASLRQTMGLKAPIFPLGPACAANRPALISAYLAWEFDRNAQPLVDFVLAALAALAELYERTSARG